MKAKVKGVQRGGTVLGVIIGVLVGLGAALAVAVYVTKVPVPFVNKGQARGADQDAAEAKKNKDWDPNAPLYGKNPAKPNPAASGVVGTASVATGSTKTGAPVVASVASASAAKAAVSTDPLGDLAKAKAGIASAVAQGSTTPGADPFTYFVQAGAYRTTEDAEAQRAKLSLLGLEAKVTEREQSGRTVFRVRIGPFDKKEDADKTKERLDAQSMDNALVRVQR